MKYYIVLFVYALLGVALLQVPLLNALQVESAAVVALAAFFVSGWTAVAAFTSGGRSSSRGRSTGTRAGQPFFPVLVRLELALLVPLAFLLYAQLQRPDCGYWQGLMFYGLFPVISVAFAVALAYLITGLKLPWAWLWFTVAGCAVVIIGPVYDLGFHPQFYTYNHVFGGVLGPVYDEELAVRSGLFAFRALTLLWAVLLYLIGRRLHGWAGPIAASGIPSMLVAALLIVVAYLFSARLGFNTTPSTIQTALGSHLATDHFDIYYDTGSLTEGELDRLAEEFEYRYAWMAGRLDMDGPSGLAPERITTYLYPDPDVKARLTGARHTSVAPVWLSGPQMHLLLDNVPTSFGHELAHVFMRPFGFSALNASLSVGLVEGVAVAVEPPDGYPSPSEQVLAAAYANGSTSRDTLSRNVAANLNPFGFWTERGAVSYTTMGSFVRYLIDQYGVEKFKQVYARANFEDVYGKSARLLASEWQNYLGQQKIMSRSAPVVATQRFARPSLFERPCPHKVPTYLTAYERGAKALAVRDTADAIEYMQRTLEEEPRYVPAYTALANIRLSQRRTGAVLRLLDSLEANMRQPEHLLAIADANALQSDSMAALAWYDSTLKELPYHAHDARARVQLRRLVANRPDVVRILTSPDSAVVQARQLADLEPQTTAVEAWRAVRLLDGEQYAEALEAWEDVPSFQELSERALRRIETARQRQLRVQRQRRARQRGWLPPTPFFYDEMAYADWLALANQRQVWLALAHLRAGSEDEAVEIAGEAANVFRMEGDEPTARALEDLAEYATWRREHDAPTSDEGDPVATSASN